MKNKRDFNTNTTHKFTMYFYALVFMIIIIFFNAVRLKKKTVQLQFIYQLPFLNDNIMKYNLYRIGSISEFKRKKLICICPCNHITIFNPVTPTFYFLIEFFLDQ